MANSVNVEERQANTPTLPPRIVKSSFYKKTEKKRKKAETYVGMDNFDPLLTGASSVVS
jgi:hypothetical protein